MERDLFQNADASNSKRFRRMLRHLMTAGATAIAASLPAYAQLQLERVGEYRTGIFDESAAEISAFDPITQRVFVVNANNSRIDVLDASDPTNPTFYVSIEFGAGAVNSVAVKDGILAAAVAAPDKTDNGLVVIMSTDGDVYAALEAGALPDMVTFTNDGAKILVANEGEPNDDYTVDPEGSVTIVELGSGLPADLAALTAADVTHVSFASFNDRKESLLNKGVRIFGPNASVAQDLEPEYIALSHDDAYAFVALQENNAFAVIDVAAAELKDVVALGTKDHSMGLPVLEEFVFAEADLPVLGASTGPDGGDVLLGGFSGMWYEDSESTATRKTFYVVPDRGPNGDSFSVDGVTNREFLVPTYQARAAKIELNTVTGKLTVVDQIMFTRKDGATPITGIPNIEGWDEKPLDGAGNAIAYDPYGADMEGVIKDPDDGSFWTVDEYRPAIYNFASDGTLIERYVPAGTSALGDTPQAAGFYGAETLPAEYRLRRANRGFEAVALDTENDIVYAFIQTPLYNPDSTTRNDSDIIRMLGIDKFGTPVAEYVYLLDRNALSGHGFARVDKIGDAVFKGDGKFLILERDSSDKNDGFTGKKAIFEIDLTGATNLLAVDAPALMAGKTLEQHSAEDLAAQGIKSVFKSQVLNLPSIGYLPTDKPEGLALLPDGSLAVTSDNDFTQGGFTDVSVGIISFDQPNGLDASNRDDAINIANWPVHGLFMPDSIATYQANGKTYIVTANEGDSRDYDGFSEEERVKDLTLDPTRFPNAETLQADENLGRLKTTTTLGDLDGDGDYDRIFSYGGRSFSIWDEFGNRVFDSGDEFEMITSQLIPEGFNASNDDNEADDRSDDKGPEPEAVAIGEIDGKTYAFIGLERVGGIMVYDISDPKSPQFITFESGRDFNGDPAADTSLDLGPEGIVFIPASQSPLLAPMIIVSNEVSGSTAFYTINSESLATPTVFRSSSIGNGDIELAWNKPAGNVEEFVVQRRDSVSGQWSTFATVNSSQDALVVSNAIGYDFRVLSSSGSNASLPSNSVSIVGVGPKAILNSSTRGSVESGDAIMINGFVVGGSGGQVLVRGAGPALADLGVEGALSDPIIRLFKGTELVAENNDWSSEQSAEKTAAFASVGAFDFAGGSRDSAILMDLQPGAYTAQLSGVAGDGIGLIEIFGATESSPVAIRNMSTRSFAGQGDDALILGFVVSGVNPRKMLVRASGPFLDQFGIQGTIADPVLTLFKGTQQLASNDDWSADDKDAIDQATARAGASAFANGSTDSAVVITLDPGLYTAVVAGADGGEGISLIEVFEIQ